MPQNWDDHKGNMKHDRGRAAKLTKMVQKEEDRKGYHIQQFNRNCFLNTQEVDSMTNILE